jgi:hypothetical protein
MYSTKSAHTADMYSLQLDFYFCCFFASIFPSEFKTTIIKKHITGTAEKQPFFLLVQKNALLLQEAEKEP